MTQQIDITVLGDDAQESDEQLTVTLSNIKNGVLGTAQAVGTIVNDDAPVYPKVAIGDRALAEGNAPLVTVFSFPVTLDRLPAAGQNLTLDWTSVDGTAVSGVDFQAAAGSLTFTSDGSLTQQINITVLGDDVEESDEQFSVTLSNIQYGTLSNATGVGTIQNDDAATPPSATIDDVSAAEGATSTLFHFTVTIDRDPPVGSPFSLAFTTVDGTATVAALDYTFASGTLTFSHGGALTQGIDVTVLGDAIVEANETFTVVLSDAVNGSFGDATGVGTIQNDDGATLPTATIDDVSAVEGSAASTFHFTVTIDRDPPVGSPFTVDFTTVDGTATTAGPDYGFFSGTLTFTNGGALTQDIAIPIVGDTVIEPDETFTVVLSNPVNGNISDASGLGTILDDDRAAYLASMTTTIGNASVLEPDPPEFRTMIFTVVINKQPLAGADLSVNWQTVALTATAGSDFVAGSGTLVFKNGDALTQQIKVTVLADALVEGNEQFQVKLSGATFGTITTDTGVGTITDDDLPNIYIDDVSKNEGATAATTLFHFTVTLNKHPAAGYPLSVQWTTASGTATAGTDFTSGTATLTFLDVDPLTKGFDITVLGDATVEANETFTITLGSPVNGVIADSQGVGTILNDDYSAYRVDATATGMPADGLTWAYAFPTVQQAVDAANAAAAPKPEVWVAAGIYTGTGTASVLQMRAGVAVYGGFGGYNGGAGPQETLRQERDYLANLSILDGQNTAYHVVVGATATLDGFTIERGNANSATSVPEQKGGGLYVDNTLPEVSNCTFTGNHSMAEGGAVFLYSTPSTVKVTGCTFSNNTSDYRGAALANYSAMTQLTSSYFYNNVADAGGAIYVRTGTVTVTSSQFEENSALAGNGGAFYCWAFATLRFVDSVFVRNSSSQSGGAIYAWSCPTSIDSCVFHDNTANSGGALASWSQSGSFFVEQSIFQGNRASSFGGAVHQDSTTSVFVNDVFKDNSAGAGGALSVSWGNVPSIINCTLYNDSAATGRELYLNDSFTNGSSANVYNSVLWNDVAGSALVAWNANVTVLPLFSHSLVRGCVPAGVWQSACGRDGGKNLDADPLFTRVPLRARQSAACLIGDCGTAKLKVTQGNSAFAVDDVIEVDDDGQSRVVTAVDLFSGNDYLITFTPALGAWVARQRFIENWGAAAPSIDLDLSLATGSSGIDAGDTTLMPLDTLDLDRDYNTNEWIPIDYARNPRLVDDPSTTDTGDGPAPLVDLGAVERQ